MAELPNAARRVVFLCMFVSRQESQRHTMRAYRDSRHPHRLFHAMSLVGCSAILLLLLGPWFTIPSAWARGAGPSPELDTDGDWIPDVWELRYGLNPANAADANLDPDGDRLTNRDEYFAGTNPTTYTAIADLTDRQLLDLYKGKAALYFWEAARSPYYFTPDNGHYDDTSGFSDNFNSIAATGFSLMSTVVADERGWVNHQAAYQRIRACLARAVALQAPAYDRLGVPISQQGNRHGYLYHFVDNQGTRHTGSEISSVDHALFVAGALTAGEYYKGTEVEQLARQLFLNTDWRWLFNGTFLYQGWIEDPSGTFDGGRTMDLWNRYSELLILVTLAMGHPDAAHAIPATAWDALTYGTGRMFPYEYAHLFPGDAPQNFGFVPNMPNTIEASGYRNSSGELHYLHAGSLHNHQYSHVFLDFRSRRDRWQTDFFSNSISATMANRQFAINLNRTAFGGNPASPDPSIRQPYETYGPESWGLMAGVASDGYKVLQPIIAPNDDFSANNISNNTDSGTVVLSAALGSVPFTPRQSVDLTRNLLTRFQQRQMGFDALVGRYGFRNAYNLGRTATGQLGHFPSAIIGLDLGPIVGSVENFETGLIWRLLLRNDFIQRGLQAAGFPTGPVEPFVLNFDDPPPAPQEDPNGGGREPNSFGGASYAFGTGSVAYVPIGDPFPTMNFGPQQWAQRISTTTNQDSGAFITLNNHSVSQWDRLSFWIRGEQGGEDYSIGLKDRVVDRLGNPLQPTEVKLRIATYHPNRAITTQWTEVRVPLRNFAAKGVRLTELDNISFTNLRTGGGTIYVDDIAFLGDEFVPRPPQRLIATTDGRSVTLNWQASPEPDVVGYWVYRSDNNGVSFAPLNTLLLVDPTFTDTAVSHRSYRYGVSAVDNAQPANASAPSANAITVAVNQAPSIAPLGPFSIAEGQRLQFVVVATDLDCDPMTLVATRLPFGATFTLLGDLNGDGRFTQADINMLITALFNPQSLTATQRELADLNGDGRLSVADLTALNAVVINRERRGRLRWTPTFSQAGGYSAIFTANDGFKATPATVVISVTDVPTPP